MRSFHGPNIVVTTPDGWEDISDLEDGLPPFLTLIKEGGDGALQFSAGRADLHIASSSQPVMEWLLAYYNLDRWGPAIELVAEDTPLILAAATFNHDSEPMRVWVITNGAKSAIIHYTIEASAFDITELAECEDIVRSTRFVSD